MRGVSQVCRFSGSILTCPFGRVELLALHRVANGGRRDGARLLHRLLPQEHLEVGRFQRVMGDRLGILHELPVALDERLVDIGVDGLEVRERGVASDRVFGAHRRDLDFRGHGGADRQLVVGQALVLEFAIEGDDRVADHVRENDVAARALDLVDHRAPFGVAELEIFVGDPLAAALLDQDLGDLGHLARIDVVRPDDEELLLAERLDDPGDEIRELLIGNGAGVDDVLRALEAFVIGRIEIQIVALLEHRQNRLAARRGVGAEHGRHAVLNDELGSLFVVGLRIGGAVLDDGLDLHSLDAAVGVDLGNRHQRRVGERFLDDR